MSTLNSPLELACGTSIPNRLLKSAMTEGLAGQNGHANIQHNRLYQTWAEGGTGLLMTGNVMVDGRYLERPGNVVVDGHEDQAALKAWAAAGTVAGNQLWAQLSHPGRQCARITSSQPLAPSAVQLKLLSNFAKPKAMTEEDITKVIAQFVYTATVMQQCGFTGVQVHAAHGYLISQFLSPVVNQRTDQWGGSLENRARLLLSVVKAIRSAVGPHFAVAIKLNSSDFQKGGFTLDECIQVVAWLNDMQVDLLEISGGSYEQMALFGRTGTQKDAAEPTRESTQRREAYFVDYAKAIREVALMPVAVTGGFRQAELIHQVIESGEIDMVGLGRPLCSIPDCSQQVLNSKAADLPVIQDGIRLGSSRWLGPNSPINAVKALNTQAAVAWCYRQIILLSKGKAVNTKLSAWKALLAHFRDEYSIGLARRKVVKKLHTK